MVEYNARFVPGLASIAAPLTALCGNDPWCWYNSCDAAMEQIKEIIASAVTLTSIKEEELALRDSYPKQRTAPPTSKTVTNGVPGLYLFLQCDASGTAAVLTKGTSWWLAEPIR